jgi:50S ribosomal subunit-associated GTPase HflX
VQTLSEPSRILFVYLAPERSSRVDLEINVTEMWQLVSTLGNAQVIDLITQKGEAYDTTYIGPGKAEEVGEFLKTNPTDIIIFNGPMKPSQKFALMKWWHRHARYR